jgi:hypothetical protein
MIRAITVKSSNSADSQTERRTAVNEFIPPQNRRCCCGCERVRMVGAQHPLLVGQQFPEQAQRLACLALSSAYGEVAVRGTHLAEARGA